MSNQTEYKNRKVLILGLAVSGYSAAKVLKELGAEVTVNDYKDIDSSDEAKELRSLGITVVSGGQSYHKVLTRT